MKSIEDEYIYGTRLLGDIKRQAQEHQNLLAGTRSKGAQMASSKGLKTSIESAKSKFTQITKQFRINWKNRKFSGFKYTRR